MCSACGATVPGSGRRERTRGSRRSCPVVSPYRAGPTTRIGRSISTPRKKPRQLRSRQTYEDILDAATQVFHREGVAATTNRIAERAGVSIGSVYQYFPNKQAVLYALAERHLDRIEQLIDDCLDELARTEPSWPETVRCLVSTAVAAHAEYGRAHTVMYEHTPRTSYGVHRLHSLLSRIIDAVAIHMRRCGVGGPDHECSAALLVYGLDAQVHRVVLAGAQRDGDRRHAVAEQVIALWSRLPVDDG